MLCSILWLRKPCTQRKPVIVVFISLQKVTFWPQMGLRRVLIHNVFDVPWWKGIIHISDSAFWFLCLFPVNQPINTQTCRKLCFFLLWTCLTLCVVCTRIRFAVDKCDRCGHCVNLTCKAECLAHNADYYGSCCCKWISPSGNSTQWRTKTKTKTKTKNLNKNDFFVTNDKPQQELE